MITFFYINTYITIFLSFVVYLLASPVFEKYSFLVHCLFVCAGPGTLTTEPVYRDIAGSDTAVLLTYNAFPVCAQSHTGDIWLAATEGAWVYFCLPKGSPRPQFITPSIDSYPYCKVMILHPPK